MRKQEGLNFKILTNLKDRRKSKKFAKYSLKKIQYKKQTIYH